MLASLGRLRLIGFLLSVAWIAVAGYYGLSRAAAKAHREFAFCHRLQVEAKATPRCAEPNAAMNDRLCGFKDADCNSHIAAADVASIAAVALVPPALIWVVVFVRHSKQRRTAV